MVSSLLVLVQETPPSRVLAVVVSRQVMLRRRVGPWRDAGRRRPWLTA